MQVILGSGGDIGTHVAKELKKYDTSIRLVSRNPVRVNEGDELVIGNLLNIEHVSNAVKGASIAYVTIGLPYSFSVWKANWPVIMQNVIETCVQHKCKLVFFDNVYMYPKNSTPHMTEDIPLQPETKKGAIRAQLVSMIWTAQKEKGLEALIARSADFYGPGSKNSFLKIGVIDNFKKGKKAFWMGDVSKKHSFTYTPDAAYATALLGNTPSAFGKTWHLPTSHQQLTGKEFIERIAGHMNIAPRYYIFKKWMAKVLGIFSPILRELPEMQYQYEQDYFFDSSKFEREFNFIPTTYEKGIENTIAATIQ